MKNENAPGDFIPQLTKEIALAALSKNNIYLKMREELGEIYSDKDFEHLFTSDKGRPPLSPGKLALITIMQFCEGLTDRQAAEAVRSRIDWKYVLGLELDDSGFNYSVLTEFRGRLIKGNTTSLLLDKMLSVFREKKLLKKALSIRSDSTHIIAAIRKLNRLECVGETLRATLNKLATIAPEWLQEIVPESWYLEYGNKFEQYRLPKEKKEQLELALKIGRDGNYLLNCIENYSGSKKADLIATSEILKKIWSQQYYLSENDLKWFEDKELTANQSRIESPYDIEARNRTKRTTNWTGYAVHLTETCDDDSPHLIINVETTTSTTFDGYVTPKIHESLEKKDLLPQEHYVDSGYLDADLLVESKEDYDINLMGRIPKESSWQAKNGEGFSMANFTVNWSEKEVICPQGKASQSWKERRDDYSNPVIEVRFQKKDCLNCPLRSQCTRSASSPRMLRLKTQLAHEALQEARLKQKDENFQKKIAKRAGIEGTISQAVRGFDLRKCRYIGLVKTKLQHIITAAAINLHRVINWLLNVPVCTQRFSAFSLLNPSEIVH